MEQTIFKQLQKAVGDKRLHFKINNNSSTMLSVKWAPENDAVSVSLHRMFLNAPTNVMEELACYLGSEKGSLPKTVRRFIDEASQKGDYAKQPSSDKLSTIGRFHDLQTAYNQVCKRHFEQSPPLQLSWFGLASPPKGSRCTLGLYHPLLKLIKVHRRLDSPLVPVFVLQYVIYHEILHYFHPSEYRESSRPSVHTQLFLEQERLFYDYQRAVTWIDENIQLLFPSG